jgi:hypothetical protein
MILDNAVIQTMPKQDKILVVTCFVKIIFRCSLSIPKAEIQAKHLAHWMVETHGLPIQDWGRGKFGYCNTDFKLISKILSFFLYTTNRIAMREIHLVPKPFVMWRLMRGVVTRDFWHALDPCER